MHMRLSITLNSLKRLVPMVCKAVLTDLLPNPSLSNSVLLERKNPTSHMRV